MKFSSIVEKINVKCCKNMLKTGAIFFELTRSVFLIEIWITSNPIFARGVSLGGKVSISSSYVFSNCDCAASIFW